MRKGNEAPQNAAGSYLAQRRRILSDDSNFHVQEAYRTLRINISFSVPGDGCKCICITSSNMREGKSINSLNIAIAFARAGHRVLLIEADMRRPSLPRLLVEKGAPGLSNILVGQCTEAQACRKGIFENLDIIFSGDIPPNPAELLGSAAMDALLEKAKLEYDYIFIDTPPIGVVSDVCVLAKHLNGALFLVYQNKTEKETVAQCIRQMELSGIRLLGFVMNHLEGTGKKYGYKYRSSEYGYGDAKR